MQRLHALCGTRLFCVSTLAGQFPDVGWHQPNEMGGIWAPPIKLLDGFWLGLRRCHDDDTDATGAPAETRWLTAPTSWQQDEDGVTRRYSVPALGIQVTRRDWIVPGESVLVVEVTVRPEDQLGRDLGRDPKPNLECGLVAGSDLHGAWLSETRLGLADGEDVAAYDEGLGAVTFHDAQHPEWSACVGAITRPDAHEIGHAVWGPERTLGAASARRSGTAARWKWSIRSACALCLPVRSSRRRRRPCSLPAMSCRSA
jgi:hypothetical protein